MIALCTTAYAKLTVSTSLVRPLTGRPAITDADIDASSLHNAWHPARLPRESSARAVSSANVVSPPRSQSLYHGGGTGQRHRQLATHLVQQIHRYDSVFLSPRRTGLPHRRVIPIDRATHNFISHSKEQECTMSDLTARAWVPHVRTR